MPPIATCCLWYPDTVVLSSCSSPFLNLAHSRSATDATTSWGAALEAESGEDEGANERGPAEPEECGGGLAFAAGGSTLRSAANDRVASEVVIVAAAVRTESSGESDGRAEPEEDNDGVKSEWDRGHDGPLLLDGRRDQENEREHGDDGAEHGVVDDGRVGAHGDHVTDESHDDERAEELEATKGQVNDVCHCDGGSEGVAR